MKDGMNKIEDLLSNPSFTRWVEGKADKAEARFWDEWCRKSDANRKLAVKAQPGILDGVSFSMEPVDNEYRWKQFSSSLNCKKELTSRKNVGKASGIWWYRIAALIIVAISTGLLTYFAGIQQKEKAGRTEVVWNHLKTDYAEKKKIALSEGSEIILGANSTLTYPEGWIRNKTIEVLLEGEAYFNISRKTEKEPAFRVKTADGFIEVLGTRFLVDAENKRTRVVLEEGMVEVKRASKNKGEEIEIAELKPDNMIEFSRSGSSVHIKRVNPAVYLSWKDNVLTLDNTSFRILINRIRKSFGLKVKVNNPGLYERRLTGSLNMKSLDDLLDAISKVLEIEVARFNDTVVFR